MDAEKLTFERPQCLPCLVRVREGLCTIPPFTCSTVQLLGGAIVLLLLGTPMPSRDLWAFKVADCRDVFRVLLPSTLYGTPSNWGSCVARSNMKSPCLRRACMKGSRHDDYFFALDTSSGVYCISWHTFGDAAMFLCGQQVPTPGYLAPMYLRPYLPSP